MERLDQRSILARLSERELADLLAAGIRKTYMKGQSLIEQGEEGDSLIVLLSGVGKVCVYSATGKEITLDYVGPGSVIGEISFLDGGARTATVGAVEPIEAIVVQQRDAMPYLAKRPDLLLRLVGVLCARLRHTNALLESDRSLAMGPKLARGLIHLVDQHGTRRDGRIGLKFALSQGDLGNFVSLSRENVNRQLREWQKLGLIDIEAGQLQIVDRDRLDEIADALA